MPCLDLFTILAQASPAPFQWDQTLLEESIKIVPGTVQALIGATLAVVVGGAISYLWASRQKTREIELSALNDLYNLYGEFFAVWKLWDRQCKDGDESTLSDAIKDLFGRASAVESGTEALFVKIASERRLQPQQLTT